MSLAIGKRVRVNNKRPSLEGAEGRVFAKASGMDAWWVRLFKYNGDWRLWGDELEVLE